MITLSRHRVLAERVPDSQLKLLSETAQHTCFKLPLPSFCQEKQDTKTESITTTSDCIMPRSAPRVELANYLREVGYLDGMKLEHRRVQQQLQTLMLLFKRQRQGGGIKRLGKSRKIGFRRTRRSRSQFFFSLLRYQQNVIASRRRFMVTYMMLTQRYVEHRLPLPKTFIWLTEILPNSPEHIFEAHTRMTRRSFGMLLSVLENKAGNYFKQKKRGRKQIPMSVQLHLAIYTLGFYGNGANHESARAKFGYGVGTVVNARRRVINALTSLTADYITWPSSRERRALCERVKERYGYHSAFFAVDGTTHPFAFVPSYQQNVWYDRKSRYSMQALVTNDMDLRVRHLVVGWPGSTHDARVLSSADYMKGKNDSEYFERDQHGLGDAAFGLNRRVVPNYKEPLASIPENVEYNRIHSSFRIKSEHTIGHVKNRFQGLKDVRLRMRTEKDVLEVVKYITAGYVLHNMMLEFEDNYRPVSNRHDSAELEMSPVSNVAVGDEEESDCTAAQFREKVKEQVLTFVGYY